MSTASTLLGRIIAVLLGVASLGACQRASYSFPKPNATAPGLAVPEVVVGTESGRNLSVVAALPSPARPVSQPHLPGRRHWAPAVATLHRPPIAGRLAVAAAGHLRRVSPAAAVAEGPVKQRSRAIAVLLAALAITYLPLSLHNFYLGYYGRGAAAIGLFVVGIYLLLLGTVGFLATSSSLTAIGYIGVGFLAGWFFWQLSDLVRIITGSLEPKNGEYRPKKARP